MIACAFEQVRLRCFAQEQHRLVEFGFDQQQFARNIKQNRVVRIGGQVTETIGLGPDLFAQSTETEHREALGDRLQGPRLGGDIGLLAAAAEQEFVECILGSIQLAACSLGQRGEQFSVSAGKNAARALKFRGIHNFIAVEQRAYLIDLRRARFGRLKIFQQTFGDLFDRRVIGRDPSTLLPIVQQFVERGEVRLQARTGANVASGKAGENGFGEHTETCYRPQFRGLEPSGKFAQFADLEWIAQPIAQRPLIRPSQCFGLEFMAWLDA